MKNLIILITFLSVFAKADEQCGVVNCSDVSKEKRQCVLKEDCSPKLRKLREEIAKLQKENDDLKANLKLEQTINEIEKKHVVRTEPENKNAVSLLVLASRTALKSESNLTTFTAKTDYEADLGLMYQRDFDVVRGSIGATLNGTFMLGAGLNF